MCTSYSNLPSTGSVSEERVNLTLGLTGPFILNIRKLVMYMPSVQSLSLKYGVFYATQNMRSLCE
jgi:hypothetical protein